MSSESRGVDDGPNTVETLPRAVSSGPWVLEFGSPSQSQSVVLRCGDSLTVGSGAAAAVRLDDRTVSSVHCRLHGTERGVGVEDLQSRNGLYVGSVRVPTAVLTGAGSSFVVGRTTVVLQQHSAESRLPLDAEAKAIPGLIGNSLPMRRLAASIHCVARLRASVLVRGESGTGKDVVARAVHALSGRQGAYLALNASAFQDSLADGELFGYQRGAFTGAVANRSGAFEEAHRGTLFLDEVADISPAVQVRLLRVLEDGVVRPLGSQRALHVDVRVLTATWADLHERVEAGRFRADLLHRISTFVLQVPPLRQRKSDIPALAAAFLAALQDEVGAKALSSAAVAHLSTYSWPGNVRELRSVLYRGAALAPREIIEPEHLALNAGFAAKRAPPAALDVLALLDQYQGNVTAASRAARIPRSTFRNWLGRARRRDPSAVAK